jgi:hypothetical protein
MAFAGGADRPRAAIRERALLLVTGGAGLRAVSRQTRIVEEVAAQFGLGLARPMVAATPAMRTACLMAANSTSE